MVRALGTAGVTLAMLGMTSSCATNAQTYSPPPASETYAARQAYASGQPTQWPLRVDTSSGQIAVYQPQPETFEGDKLTARAAVSLTPAGATDPVFGALWLGARVATDRDSRTVTILDAQVKRVRFPDSDEAQQGQFARILEQEIPRMNVTFSLDELLASLEVVEKEKVAIGELQTAPPKIIVTNITSTLVVIDGEPKLQPVEQTRVMRVVNTPFILLLDMDSKRYFLKAGEAWFSATDIKGQWTPAANIPVAVADTATKLAPPPDQANPNAAPAAGTPAPAQPIPRQVIVATEPTELISTDGPPTYTPVQGNDLLYISNTQSDVFMEVGSQTNYVLLSGRWYRSRSLQGPWEYVAADKLPPAFANIPGNSPKGHVLASVAGTEAARDARYDAAIPQTATVKRTGGETINVAYDGEPQFASVQDSPVRYAINTPESVLLVDNRYYCCHQAVWYESSVAAGPWAVCVSVPSPIYALPPSCPVYHVRYCYVYDYTPDVVYCGYVAGYTGSYVYGPTVVYGTGYYYGGWYGTSYYARPWTWGCGVRYDPYVATWGFGAPYGWDRRWMVRDSDRYDHGWFGPRGYVGYRGLSRVNNGTELRDTHVNLNIYNRNENITRNVTINRNVNINRGNRDVTINRNEAGRNDGGGNDAAANRRGGYTPPTAGANTYQNNVYAGHDGQVYRRTNDGWEQRGKQGWQKLNAVPEATQVERGARAGNAGDRGGNAAARDDNAAARNSANANRGEAGNAGRGANANAAERAGNAGARAGNAGERGGAANAANRAGNEADRAANGADRGNAAANARKEAPPANRRVDVPEEARRGPNDNPPAARNRGDANQGLEADHAARQRGEQRIRGDSGEGARQTPSRSDGARGDGGGNRGAGAGAGGGNSGGNRGAGGGGGGGGARGDGGGGGSGSGRGDGSGGRGGRNR